MEEKTMKRATLVLLALLLVVACAPKGMKLVYNTQSGTPIKTEPVYLKIKDVRNDKMLVSSAVMRADKFTNVGDRFNLTAQGTGGRTVQLQNVTVSEAFQEAFRLRLQGLRRRDFCPTAARREKPWLLKWRNSNWTWPPTAPLPRL
jgi:hypothetical protein